MALTGVLRPGHVAIRVLETGTCVEALPRRARTYRDRARRQGEARLPQGLGRARSSQRRAARSRRGGHGLHGLARRFAGDAEEARAATSRSRACAPT